MNRIVSLVPAATEILAALGLADRIVGRTHECDHPPETSHARIVTRPRIDTSAPSADIDTAVRGALRSGDPLFDLDERAVRDLAPDLIVTQGFCPVCAISPLQVQRVAAMLPSQPAILRMQPMTLDDVFADVVRLGELAGRGSAADACVRKLRARVYDCVLRGTFRTARPSVLLLEWLDPFFAAGHWNPQLVELAGAEPLLATAGRLSKSVTLEQIHRADPDIILVAPCGFDARRARAELTPLSSNPRWTSLRAVRTHQTHICDGSSLFNRPGPRLVDSLEHLSLLLDSYKPLPHFPSPSSR